jgi:hypothetical protein
MQVLREKEKSSEDPCGCGGGGNGKKKEQDLDRLARAILPVVKRMLAIERDRRNPRMLL